jgi:catechol 2,3-dioxygenase-like lactoylglutathione lyase family enzyme
VGVINRVHHLGLTVRDVDASASWYVDVLGFRRSGEFVSSDGARRKVFLHHAGLQTRLGLTQHRDGGQDLFDETRVGLDHRTPSLVPLFSFCATRTTSRSNCSSIRPRTNDAAPVEHRSDCI